MSDTSSGRPSSPDPAPAADPAGENRPDQIRSPNPDPGPDAVALVAREETTPMEGSGPRCRVCAHPIQAGNLVYCVTCESPHHADCFEYAGGCALFGCGQKRFRLKPHGRAHSLAPVAAANAIRVEAHTRLRSVAMALGAAGMGVAGLEILACLANPAVLVFLAQFPMLVALALLVPGSLFSGAALIATADQSHFRYDPATDCLELVKQIANQEIGRRTWQASDIDRVELFEPKGPGGGLIWLTVVTRSGERLHVACDNQSMGRGYDEADLVRMGNRIARSLNVPFTHHAPMPAGERLTLP